MAKLLIGVYNSPPEPFDGLLADLYSNMYPGIDPWVQISLDISTIVRDVTPIAGAETLYMEEMRQDALEHDLPDVLIEQEILSLVGWVNQIKQETQFNLPLVEVLFVTPTNTLFIFAKVREPTITNIGQEDALHRLVARIRHMF